MIGPFIMLIGIGLLYVAAKGKSAQVIEVFFKDAIQSAEQRTAASVTTWFKKNVWDALTNAIASAIPFGRTTNTTNQSAGGGGSNSLVQHFEVPLQGGGFMTVNASDYNAAVENVKAEGGTPQP